MLIAGDFYIHNNVIKSVNFNSFFKDIQDIISRNEYRVLNLESPILKDSIHYKKNPKIGPNLSMHESVLDLIHNQFNYCTLANNHIMDYCTEGVKDTLLFLQNKEISYVGVYNKGNAEHSILKINNRNIGIVNVAENEFLTDPNSNEFTVSSYDPISNYYLINDLRGKVDFLICIYHGGNEHINLPSPELVKRTRFLIDLGCDIVICHHTHIISGMQLYKDKPIFFGIGNFVFDNNRRNPPYWHIGMLVELRFEKKIEYNVIPFKYDNKNKCIKLLRDREKDNWLQEYESINHTINNADQLMLKFNRASHLQIQKYNGFMEVIGNKHYQRIAKHGILPSIFRPKKILMYENLIRCETHRENILRLIQSKKK